LIRIDTSGFLTETEIDIICRRAERTAFRDTLRADTSPERRRGISGRRAE